MKTIILAAGSGTRLGEDNPKPLTLLANGKSILEMQLDTLSHYTSLDDVWLIVGYKKDKIMDAFPNQLYLYNPNYAHENTAKSLLRALHKIHEDVLWINGDVVFHPAVLQAILKTNKNSMVVNVGPVGDEEVKYRTDSKGKILEVSKEVQKSEGEALGLNFFTVKDLAVLKKNLIKCNDNDYFEKAIELCIEEGLDVWSTPVPQSYCIEIDFHEDLITANQKLTEWN